MTNPLDVRAKVPNEEFRKVLNEYASRSKRSFKDSINSRLLDILIKAYMKTRRADFHKIEAALGVIGYNIGKFVKKTGVFKRYKRARAAVSGQSLVYRLVQIAYWKKTGQHMRKSEVERAARAMLGKIKSRIGFIASGWIPGIKALSALRGARGGAGSARSINFKAMGDQKGQDKGFARPANSDEHPIAEAGNTTKAAEPITGPAVEAAMAESMRYMEETLRKNHEDALRGLSGKTYG